MFTVKRAIIMAAGLGSRLRPLTNITPKPLLVVGEKRIIETVIDALLYNRINEIYIVVGYQKEKFSILLQKYPFLRLIENPYYEKLNNISSLYVARKHLGDTVIIDGDQIVLNPKILSPAFAKSGYCCSKVMEPTNEWVLQVKNDTAVYCSRNGGSQGWQLYGISFWNQEDGQRLAEYVQEDIKKGENQQLYWDDIALFLHPKSFTLGIREIQKEDLYEIDSVHDLQLYKEKYEAFE